MKKCPLLNKKCIEHECEWYVHLIGKNPQTNADMDQFGCSISWLPILLVENSQMTRQVSAALDRNNNNFVSVLPEHLQQRIAQGSSNLLTNGK